MFSERARRASWSAGSLFVGALVLTGCRSEPAPLLDAPVPLTQGDTRVLAIDDADERWRPALEALRAAVDAGDERAARAILERLYLAEPRGTALEIAQAYEKILDGRALVASLALALEAEFERDPSGAGVIVVWLKSSTSDPRALDVAPGPCTLRVTQTAIDPAGDETKSLETMTVASPIRVLLKDGAPVRIPLAQMPFGARKGALASRAAFELEARAGSITVDGRELPAQRFNVAAGEVVVLAKELANLELSTPLAFSAHIADGTCDPRTALSLAVRLPRADRAETLDALADAVDRLSTPALEALAPALRWFAPEENLGRDAATWKAYLVRRAETKARRPDLLLPRAKSSTLAGS